MVLSRKLCLLLFWEARYVAPLFLGDFTPYSVVVAAFIRPVLLILAPWERTESGLDYFSYVCLPGLVLRLVQDG